MNYILYNGQSIAVYDSGKILNSVQDVLDIMATTQYEGGCDAVILYKESLPEAFFDLKTRFAGEILQKFSNYRMRLAIVGDFSGYTSKALRDFIYECNAGNRIFWATSEEEAIKMLHNAQYDF